MDVLAIPVRPERMGSMAAEAKRRPNSTTIVQSIETLGAHPRFIVDAPSGHDAQSSRRSGRGAPRQCARSLHSRPAPERRLI